MSMIKAYMEYLDDNDIITTVQDFTMISIDIVENPVYPDAVILEENIMSEKKEWFIKLIELSDSELKFYSVLEEVQYAEEQAKSKWQQAQLELDSYIDNLSKYIEPGFYKLDGKIIKVEDGAFGIKIIVEDEPEYTEL